MLESGKKVHGEISIYGDMVELHDNQGEMRLYEKDEIKKFVNEGKVVFENPTPGPPRYRPIEIGPILYPDTGGEEEGPGMGGPSGGFGGPGMGGGSGARRPPGAGGPGGRRVPPGGGRRPPGRGGRRPPQGGGQRGPGGGRRGGGGQPGQGGGFGAPGGGGGGGERRQR